MPGDRVGAGLVVALGFGFAFTATPGIAQQGWDVEPIATDRPSFSESPTTVDGGHVQLEAGYTLARASGTTGHTLGEILIRIGLDAAAELRIGLDSYAWSRGPAGARSGFTDTSLGVKLGLAEGDAGIAHPSLGLVVASTLPTGHDPFFGETTMQPEAKLAAGWMLGNRTSLKSNLNYAYISDRGSRVHRLATSLVLAHRWTERIGSYVEGYGFVPRSVARDDVIYINGGLTYLVSPRFQLDARLGLRVADPADRFAGVGLAYRW